MCLRAMHEFGCIYIYIDLLCFKPVIDSAEVDRSQMHLECGCVFEVSRLSSRFVAKPQQLDKGHEADQKKCEMSSVCATDPCGQCRAHFCVLSVCVGLGSVPGIQLTTISSNVAALSKQYAQQRRLLTVPFRGSTCSRSPWTRGMLVR